MKLCIEKVKTKEVKVDICFGNTIETLYAYIIPSININLNLPNLSKVVKMFTSRGFKLADNKLINYIDNISNLNFILGSKSNYCIPEQDILFGKNNHSVYSQTPIGIMLKGDIPSLLQDLPY